jgi:hypothetical protein
MSYQLLKRQATPCQQQQGDASGGGDDAAAKAAADAAAAEAAKAAADKAAVDKAAADKAAADAAAAKGDNKPTDAEAKLLKEVMKAKEQKKLDDAALAQAKEQLAKYDGIDPEVARKQIADAKSAEDAKLAAAGEWDRLKQNMATENAKALKLVQDQLDAANAALTLKSKTINQMSIGQQFSNSKFIADELVLTPGKARVVYGDYFDVQEDGSVVGYDKPRGAEKRTAIVDAAGNPKAFDDVLRTLVEGDSDRDALLKSKAKAGAGSDSKKPTGSASSNQDVTGVAKISAALLAMKKPLV